MFTDIYTHASTITPRPGVGFFRVDLFINTFEEYFKFERVHIPLFTY
jgi:hypothetical protein